jgi:hypothetical protein
MPDVLRGVIHGNFGVSRTRLKSAAPEELAARAPGSVA